MKYLVIILLSLSLPALVRAADFRGRFVINPVDNQAWFVRADNKKILTGNSAFALFKLRSLAQVITDRDWALIASSASTSLSTGVSTPLSAGTSTPLVTSTTSTLAMKLQGKILHKASDNSLWYLDPSDRSLASLATPLAFNLLLARSAARPSYHDFARLHKPVMNESIDRYSYYQREKITTANKKKFTVDSIMIDLSMPNLKISSLAAASSECAKDCPARNVADFTASAQGFAAINGTYFDTSASKKNYTFFPLYDTKTGVLLNKAELKKWSSGPIVAFDEANHFYYFTDSRLFLPAISYDASGKMLVTQGAYSGPLTAALGSFPRLIEEGNDKLIEWAMDAKQRDARAMRAALGYKNNKLYLIVSHNSTVSDLTAVCLAMGMDYALNLDGGYSTALFYNHEYVLGPGRDVVNALVFSQK